jgi:hypothetical protein
MDMLLYGVGVFVVVFVGRVIMTSVANSQAQAVRNVTMRPCPECLADVPIAAKRCCHCGQPLPPAAQAQESRMAALGQQPVTARTLFWTFFLLGLGVVVSLAILSMMVGV